MPDLGAWCSDFCVNQRIGLRLNLPESREPTLELFDRLRREHPRLTQVRRHDEEIALESEHDARDFMWVALRKTSIKSGHLNPISTDDGYRMHRTVLTTAPWFLSLTPLDIECIELTFGMDIEVDGPRDAVVCQALFGASPLAALLDSDQETAIDVQPFVGISLTPSGELAASFEVKTRPKPPGELAGLHSPISVYVTVRRQGPLASLDELPTVFATLCGHAERLCEQRAIPHLVVPIRQAIGMA